MSKNEGSWKAAIRSTLVGGEQELGFKERIQKEKEARETLKGGTGKTFRGNGMQQGPCHCKPGVRSMGKEGLFGAVAELCKQKKLASWLCAVVSLRVNASTPRVSEDLVYTEHPRQMSL